MRETTITRQQMVSFTERAIRRAGTSPEESALLRHVARTERKVLRAHFGSADTACGCPATQAGLWTSAQGCSSDRVGAFAISFDNASALAARPAGACVLNIID